MFALDIILLALMVFAIVRGCMKGLVMEVASLLGIVVSAFIAKNYGVALMGGIVSFLGWQTEMNSIVSIVIIFLLSMLLVRLLAALVAKVLKIAMLGWLDKLLGGVAALAKCLMIMGVLLYAFDKMNNMIHLFEEEDLAKSKLYEPVKSVAYIVFPSDTNMVSE
ncbi:MAG: CvpA family protein [Paludibacteraceae bacterium]|nr:CvpA family protein [Paludibacteraceae bacterium]